MKQTIEQTVAAVKNAPGSMYTREDVISLLEKIEIEQAPETEAVVLTSQQVSNLCKKIISQINDNADNLCTSDVVDLDSAEFCLNGNEISLDSVDIDTNQIADSVVDGIGDVIEEFFEELNEDEELPEGEVV